MPDFNLNYIYIAISWILLRWHDFFTLVLPLDPASGLSWVLSIAFLVITIRTVLFPVFVRQIKSQRAMSVLQPQVKALQEKHKGDKETLQKEMMELYRREKANPLMGCLPIFVQIPVFLGLFHVLRLIDPTSDANRKAMTTEYYWTESQFDFAASAQLFGVPLAAAFNTGAERLAALGADGVTVKIAAAVLIAIMVSTTYITQRQLIARTANSGQPIDPQQAMIQKLMLYGIPASLLISGALFPIGVVLYWVTNNLFSMGQQFWVLKYMPPVGAAAAEAAAKAAAEAAPAQKALAPKPGVKPVNPKKGRPAPRSTPGAVTTEVGAPESSVSAGITKPSLTKGAAAETDGVTVAGRPAAATRTAAKVAAARSAAGKKPPGSPGAARAGAARAGATKPATGKPGATKPAGTKPAGIKPAATKPAATKPVGTKPVGTKPAGTKPAGTKPAGTEPAVTTSATTEPTTAKSGAAASSMTHGTASNGNHGTPPTGSPSHADGNGNGNGSAAKGPVANGATANGSAAKRTNGGGASGRSRARASARRAERDADG